MANLTIKYEDGSTQEWGLTEREADVAEFHIEKLFGKPKLSSNRSHLAKEEDRKRAIVSSTQNV